MNILSIDFGGSSVKYGVVDENAAIKESGRLPAPLASPEVFCETVKTLYNQYKGLIDGIGISIPGNVDPDSGVLSENGVYKQLYGKNVIRLVQETCGLPAARKRREMRSPVGSLDGSPEGLPGRSRIDSWFCHSRRDH